ncbi:MAG TPA: hypothetical protein VMB50_11460, partial [Myxococcales bacterium]|nr:hypothetical protein [Myxococcales bacterium]
MKTSKALALSLTGLAAVMTTALACKPSTGNPTNTCVNAVAGVPDGSINPAGTWTGSCSTGALEAAVNQLIADAGVCTEDSDCVFLTDGGPFVYHDYTEAYVNPIALSN